MLQSRRDNEIYDRGWLLTPGERARYYATGEHPQLEVLLDRWQRANPIWKKYVHRTMAMLDLPGPWGDDASGVARSPAPEITQPLDAGQSDR